jgi:hypothetical protein
LRIFPHRRGLLLEIVLQGQQAMPNHGSIHINDAINDAR